jgi:hypothetical protein
LELVGICLIDQLYNVPGTMYQEVPITSKFSNQRWAFHIEKKYQVAGIKYQDVSRARNPACERLASSLTNKFLCVSAPLREKRRDLVVIGYLPLLEFFY